MEVDHRIKQSTSRTVDVSAVVSGESDVSTNVQNWKLKWFYLLAEKGFNWGDHDLLTDKNTVVVEARSS